MVRPSQAFSTAKDFQMTYQIAFGYGLSILAFSLLFLMLFF
jgi:hypothetical protein